jgi:anion-transporting  ArsA/GET3 family ATPase
MKGKLFVGALFKFRNIAFLLLSLFIVIADESGFLGLQSSILKYSGFTEYIIAAAIYLVLVLQSFTSKAYQDKFMRGQKIKQIKHLNTLCFKLFSETRKNVNQAYLKKLRKMMEDRNEIVTTFFRGERNYLKEKIVEQTLNLVVSYIKLTNNYCLRSRELSSLDVSEVADRVNMNARKMSFLKDPYAIEDLKKVIDMDERIIQRLKDEKKDLERIHTKLDYMESAVNMFKHHILSNIESEELLDKLETTVNEAYAMDSVLQERRKTKQR